MDDSNRLSIGGNFPPEPIPTPPQIAAALRETCSHLLTRRDELVAAVEIFLAECPQIDDDDQQAAATDNLEIMRQTIAEAETRRVDEKEPFLAGGRAVDAFFNGEVKAPVEAARAKLHAIANAYADKLREARKAAAEAEAAIKRAQAERLIAEMDKGGSFDAARIAAEEAEAATRVAAGGASVLTVTRGNYGTRSAQHERFVWEITDPEAVPRDLCSPDKVKINAAVKAGMRLAAGLRIYEERKLRTRS